MLIVVGREWSLLVGNQFPTFRSPFIDEGGDALFLFQCAGFWTVFAEFVSNSAMQIGGVLPSVALIRLLKITARRKLFEYEATDLGPVIAYEALKNYLMIYTPDKFDAESFKAYVGVDWDANPSPATTGSR